MTDPSPYGLRGEDHFYRLMRESLANWKRWEAEGRAPDFSQAIADTEGALHIAFGVDPSGSSLAPPWPPS